MVRVNQECTRPSRSALTVVRQFALGRCGPCNPRSFSGQDDRLHLLWISQTVPAGQVRCKAAVKGEDPLKSSKKTGFAQCWTNSLRSAKNVS